MHPQISQIPQKVFNSTLRNLRNLRTNFAVQLVSIQRSAVMNEQEPGVPGGKLPEATPNLPEGKPGRYANRLGPKPCLDVFRQEQICAIVGKGLTLQTAADYVGVERRTVYRTALRNAAFGAALREARSCGATRLMLRIHETAAE